MDEISVDMVWDEVSELLKQNPHRPQGSMA
jgi:hypothetical protein